MSPALWQAASEWLRYALVIYLLYREQQLVFDWLKILAAAGNGNAGLMLALRQGLRLTGISVVLPLLLPEFPALPVVNAAITISTKLLIIWSVCFLVLQLITALEERYINHKLQLNLTNFHDRSLATKTRIYRRIASGMIIILAVAASCLLFDSVRALGASILASAGIVTGLIGLAANKILSNFFAGIQLALTQPIRINDAITVEGEFGVVEDISLNYVVVRIWDLRRMVLPITYFLEKPFLNFSRSSTDIITQINFYTDYSVPIDKIRTEFNRLVQASSYWDHNTLNLQVSELTEDRVKFRGIASSANPGDAWNLRCEVQEKLISYIASNFPQSLPRLRLADAEVSQLASKAPADSSQARENERASSARVSKLANCS
jgi:small-conductance mechanosensitive channel